MKAGGRDMLSKIPCPSFKKDGSCRYGETCWMLHAPAEPKQQPSANAASTKLLEQQLEAVASLEALTGANNAYGNNMDNDDKHDDNDNCNDEYDNEHDVYYLANDMYPEGDTNPAIDPIEDPISDHCTARNRHTQFHGPISI